LFVKLIYLYHKLRQFVRFYEIDPKEFQFCFFRAKVIKLASQEEYNTERFKILQANATSFKKEISQLESKKSSLQSELAKREHSIQVLPLIIMF
jgi:hypothetical protein